MKFADHLTKEQKQQLNKIKYHKNPGGYVNPKKKRIGGNTDAQRLSRKDIEELMGIHQDTYTRKNGAVRRK